jgi:hypothetical protein
VIVAPNKEAKTVVGHEATPPPRRSKTAKIPAPDTSGTRPSNLKLMSSVARMAEQISE